MCHRLHEFFYIEWKPAAEPSGRQQECIHTVFWARVRHALPRLDHADRKQSILVCTSLCSHPTSILQAIPQVEATGMLMQGDGIADRSVFAG